MAMCKECVHHPVCKVWGGLFPKRTDVERICEHFMEQETDALQVVKSMKSEFDAFWKQQFGEKADK